MKPKAEGRRQKAETALATAALCLVLVTGGTLAEEPTTGQTPATSQTPAASETPAPSPTADLIEAAKGAKERRKKSRTRVITNADVKKSKGKIVEGKPGEITVTAPGKTLPQQYQETLAAQKEAEVRFAAAETRVAELTKEAAAIEQSYYDENNLDHRDGVIVPRFEEVRRKLNEANRELDEARAALGKLSSD